MRIERCFTRAGDNGYAGVIWEQRTASIIGEGGKVVFEQRDVEVPSGWSQTATNVVVQKYFRGQLGTPGRERSAVPPSRTPGGGPDSGPARSFRCRTP